MNASRASSLVPRSNARARKGVGAAQSAVDGVGLTIHVGGIVAGEKQGHGRDFARLAVATQRVELADLALGATRPCGIEDRLCHARLDEARTDGIDAYAGAVELIGRGLHQADDAGL